MYKIVFAGTPQFAVKYLKSLINDERFFVSKIITQEDKKFWRKQEIKFPDVKIEWLKNWIEVLQPKTKEEITKIIQKEKPDFFIVVAYWKILPKESLEIAKFNINVHGSILPKYRGASPIQSAILNWEKETWISIMNIEEKMDVWNVWNLHKCEIKKYDTSEDIFNKLSEMSELFPNDLDNIFQWKLVSKKQEENLATYCKKIKKEDWEINFKEEFAENIFNKLNSFTPWPWIFTFFNWKKLKIIKADFQENLSEKNIWEVFKENWEIFIQTKKWVLKIIEVQLEWKKPTKILDFLNGQKDFIWAKL